MLNPYTTALAAEWSDTHKGHSTNLPTVAVPGLTVVFRSGPVAQPRPPPVGVHDGDSPGSDHLVRVRQRRSCVVGTDHEPLVGLVAPKVVSAFVSRTHLAPERDPDCGARV